MNEEEGHRPRLSVIVPTFERPELLEIAYQSLRAQTFTDFEVIVVDDASGDDTPQKIAELAAHDARVRGLRLERNSGPGAARNRALELCRGELVALLDDDDRAAPDRFERQIALLDQRPEIDLVASTIGWEGDDGVVFRILPGILRRGELPDNAAGLFRFLYLEGNYVPTSSLLARRAALQGLTFLEGVRAGEDWFFLLQATGRGHRLAALPEPLAFARRGTGHNSLMSSKAKTFPFQRRVLRELRSWLDQQGLHHPSALHRAAMAQQYLREARFWGGLRAVLLCLRASVLAPGAPRLGETWRFLGALALGKLGRLKSVFFSPPAA